MLPWTSAYRKLLQGSTQALIDSSNSSPDEAVSMSRMASAVVLGSAVEVYLKAIAYPSTRSSGDDWPVVSRGDLHLYWNIVR